MDEFDTQNGTPKPQGTPSRVDGVVSPVYADTPSFGATPVSSAPTAQPQDSSDDMPSLSPEDPIGPLNTLTPGARTSFSPSSPNPAPYPIDQPSPITASVPEATPQASSAISDFAQPAATVANPAASGPKAKHHVPKAAVFVAGLVLLLLVGLAVFAFLESQTQEDPSATPVDTTTETEAVTPSDVDQTSEDIDEALNGVDDTQDFDETEINDGTLNL